MLGESEGEPCAQGLVAVQGDPFEFSNAPRLTARESRGAAWGGPSRESGVFLDLR